MEITSLARLAALLALAWAILHVHLRAPAPEALGPQLGSKGLGNARHLSWVSAPVPSPLHATRLALGDWGVIEGQAPLWPAPPRPERVVPQQRPCGVPAPLREPSSRPQLGTPDHCG